MTKITLTCLAIGITLSGCAYHPLAVDPDGQLSSEELRYSVRSDHTPIWTESQGAGNSLATLIKGFNLYRNASALTSEGIRQELRARTQAEFANPSELYNLLY